MLQDIRAQFPPRAENSHKGTYGNALLVCGSYGMAGAAVLAAKAALRCGVGLATAAMPQSIYPIIAAAVPEAVCVPYTEGGAKAAVQLRGALSKATAVLVGCGLSQSREAAELTAAVLREATVPVVLDADGINAAAKHIDITEARRAPLVLTPHPLEMARLLHCSVEEVQRDRTATALEAARQFRAVAVLKGHGTVVASPDGEVAVNTTGNPGMAVGGSGDVLAGMIASLLAQGLSPFEAARCGVWLHGAAGDRAAARLSQHAMLPSDMVDELGALFLKLEQAE